MPLKGTFEVILNYFEKGSKVAWQEHVKYREYIFASSENLLTRKEKVENIRKAIDKEIHFCIISSFAREILFNTKREKLKSFAERLTKKIDSV